MRVTGDPAVLLAEPGASQRTSTRSERSSARPPLWSSTQAFHHASRPRRLRPVVLLPTDVFELYLSRLPASLLLASAAMTFSLIIGIPTDHRRGARQSMVGQRGEDLRAARLSMPSFWVGLIMILFFSVYLGWLPSSGSGTVLHLVMPSIALGWVFAGRTCVSRARRCSRCSAPST